MHPGGDEKNTVSGSSSGDDDDDGTTNDTQSEVEARQETDIERGPSLTRS